MARCSLLFHHTVPGRRCQSEPGAGSAGLRWNSLLRVLFAFGIPRQNKRAGAHRRDEHRPVRTALRYSREGQKVLFIILLKSIITVPRRQRRKPPKQKKNLCPPRQRRERGEKYDFFGNITKNPSESLGEKHHKIV